MILFKLLSLNERSRVIRRWLENPAREAREYVHELLMGYITGVIIVSVIVLGGLALLGFAPVFDGPYQAARVLFYVACVFLAIIGTGLWALWRKIHGLAGRLEDMYRRSNAQDADYETRDTMYIHEGGEKKDN